MDYIYDFKIHGIEIYPNYKDKQNVICKIHYTLTGRGGNYANGMILSTEIDYDSNSEFIPYESITNEMLINWLEINKKNELDIHKKSIKIELDKQVYSQPIYLNFTNN